MSWLLLSAMCLLAPPQVTAQDNVAGVIQGIIEDKTHPDLRWPDLTGYEDELTGLYQPSGYASIWLEGTKPRPDARQVIDLLLDAHSRGLNPEDYDAQKLDEQSRGLESGGEFGPESLAELDTAISIGILRLVSDLHIGRINPKNLHFGLDIESKKYDLARLVRDALAAHRIPEMVAEAEPRFQVYARLKKALVTYRQLAAEPPRPPLPVIKKLEPGGTYQALPALRDRLIMLGDLPAEPNAPASPAPTEVPAAASPVPAAPAAQVEDPRYEGEIVEAVKRFQERHGLDPDGVLGPATLEQLNVPLDRRVKQIELALERLRWLPDFTGGRTLIANIPGFRLYAFDGLGDQIPALSMNVIVGKSVSRTPIFANFMKYIVFRPYWNVPRSITIHESLPKIRKDPGYLDKQDMEIVAGKSGDDTKALPVTDENIAALATGGTRLRQRPGPNNSMGLAKFIFPNAANVYMHGTDAQSLFQKYQRDFSHGCIRLEDPAKLAEWVLSKQPGWAADQIQAAMNGPKLSVRVDLAEPLAVYIFYATAAVDIDGRIHFWDDVYGHDGTLEQALAQGYPYPP